jgi:multisubunit Na+/H+ antiporter MnhG subunit
MRWILGYAVGFFVACLLVYFGVQMLKSTWWVLLIVFVVLTAAVIAYRIWKNRPRW